MANNRAMKLTDLYPTLKPDERVALAKAACIADGYLYQIASRWRGKRASLEVIKRLAAADDRLTVEDMVSEFTEKAAAATPQPTTEPAAAGAV